MAYKETKINLPPTLQNPASVCGITSFKCVLFHPWSVSSGFSLSLSLDLLSNLHSLCENALPIRQNHQPIRLQLRALVSTLTSILTPTRTSHLPLLMTFTLRQIRSCLHSSSHQSVADSRIQTPQSSRRQSKLRRHINICPFGGHSHVFLKGSE